MKEEGEHETCLTVRLFGPNTDYVINREREFQVIFSFINLLYIIMNSFISYNLFLCHGVSNSVFAEGQLSIS